ncbi:MAG: hypothetical protein KF754_08500 [Planctomycetes bacterium]|nr:hypothetical protein [Planctomycetota bacterium]
MHRLLLLILLVAAPLAANDLAVSTPQGGAAWLLLEPPPGPAGEGLGARAGDPGLFAPDVLGRAAAGRPGLDLWRYDRDSARYTRITEIAGAWAYAVFELRGQPHLLVNAPGRDVAPTLVVRADGLRVAGGAVPAGAVALASSEFADAPAVSPDGSRLALRAFRTATTAVLRVYDTTSWALLAESSVEPFSRPVWISNSSLCCLTSDTGIARVSMGDRGAIPRVNDNPPSRPGRLLRLDLEATSLKLTVLRQGEFPSETFTRALVWDAHDECLVFARSEGDRVSIEQMQPRADAAATQVALLDQFRGLASGGFVVRFAGVKDRVLQLGALVRWRTLYAPRPGGGLQYVGRLPFGPSRRVVMFAQPQASTSGLGGLIDLKRGMFGLIEPAANPDHAADGQPICLHTLRVPPLGLDSMANPRNLARVSALVKRFAELDAHYPRGIPSTLLAFDMKISLQGADPKKGTYVELYHGDGRGGKGRIRTEDNLSGDWLMNSIDGGGDATTDWHYACANIKGGSVEKQSPARAGKVYDDLVTQLEARKLLLLSGVAGAPERGGLVYLGRGTHTDLGTGVEMRVWRYLKQGRLLADGRREAVELRFVADLPQGSRGTWKFPHGLLHARMVFAMANGRDAAQTDLSFSPDAFVELPNLTDPGKPNLLLPAEFRIHEWDEATRKPIERLHAKAKTGEFTHPAELVEGGRLKPGYFVPTLSVPVILRAAADRQFQQLQRPGGR